MLNSTLSPPEKAILAMSRAQYEEFLSSPDYFQDDDASSLAKAYKRDQIQGPSPPLLMTPSPIQADGSSVVDSTKVLLSVGVCIIRLDPETSEPVMLLLRRSSPLLLRQEQKHVSISTPENRQRLGDWELPGGRVRHDDFCISAAIERLVRAQTGLKVIKIMEMLMVMNWNVEVKLLKWGGEHDYDVDHYLGDDEVEDDDDDEYYYIEAHEQREIEKSSADKGSWGHSHDLGITNNLGDSESSDSNVDKNRNIPRSDTPRNGQTTKDDSSSYDEMFMKSVGDDVGKLLGIYIPTDPSSSPSSTSPSPPLTGEISSSPSPFDFQVQSRRHSSHNHEHEYSPRHNRNDANQGQSHEPLRPAPLSLSLSLRTNRTTLQTLPPPRPPRDVPTPYYKPHQPQHYDQAQHTRRYYDTERHQLQQRHRQIRCTPTSPLRLSRDEPRPPAPLQLRPRAQVIPYKILRARHRQLNYTVLVDESVEVPVPSSLLGGKANDAKNKKNGDHDVFEWATLSRVRQMQMNDDLRRVVFQGFAWMEDLYGGFI
ncbi:hypothetical protein GGS20DRAFT_539298 [Poronia punctata]|nr:hypothetical protein GGS20DRAFT_539298 [Poronia punctata]